MPRLSLNLQALKDTKGERINGKHCFPELQRKTIKNARANQKLPSDDAIEGSTNLGRFIEYFTMDDSKWIQTINNALDG